MLILFFFRGANRGTQILPDILGMFLAQVIEAIGGRFGALVFGEVFSLECKSRDIGRFVRRGALCDPVNIDLTMFLPLARNEVNSVTPAGTDPDSRFRLILEIPNDRRIA